MRRPSVYTDRHSTLDVKMTPMIDVVFLLLIFFVWTASFQIVEYALPGVLSTVQGTEPSAADLPPPPEEDFDDVVVRIRKVGERLQWEVNGTMLDDFQMLRGRLKQIAEIKVDTTVILHPEPDVPLGGVIDAYDAARLEGFDQVGFATSEAV